MTLRRNQWRRTLAVFSVSVLALSLGACDMVSQDPKASTTATASATGPITVVASVNQWGSLAEQIGGSDVKVTSILGSTAVDAHNFEPKTADIASVQQANIVVFNGVGYDAWATKNLVKNTISVSASDAVGAVEGDNPHLWFSKDARNAVASELAEAFTKARPAKKKAFAKRLKTWKRTEQKLESTMKEFKQNHSDASYAASEAVAYYLMSDMGLEDKTPQGYAQSAASEGEPAPADLKAFQELLEKSDVDILVNNTQEPSDTANLLIAAAKDGDVPVFDITEQMPKNYTNLTDWIASLVDTLSKDLPASQDTPTGDDDDAATSTPNGTSTGTDER